MTPSLTFDWNCIIAVERNEPQARYVATLVDLHRNGMIDVGVTTVSASENLVGSRAFPGSGRAFRARISALGWDDLTVVLGPAVVGLTYIGLSKIVGETFPQERDALWAVVSPTISQQLPPGMPTEEFWLEHYAKWRNAWCDVHTLWTHIDSGRGIFVTTNTRDFQSKSGDLKKLGLGKVLTPEFAASQFTGG